MARLFILSLGLLIGASALAQLAASPAPRPKTERVSGNLYVKFRKNTNVSVEALKEHATGITDIDRLLDRYSVYDVTEFDPNAKNIAICRKHGIDRMYVLYFQPENNVMDVAEAFRAVASIESVSPRYIFKPSYIPNDPQWGSQWGLKSNRMNFETAWNSEKGDTNVIIAVLDGGVNYTHEDLAPNLAINWKETGLDNDGNDKRFNGKDDDGDGYRDNWHGWDLAGNTLAGKPKPDNDPMPDTALNTHGTLVAGCAAARPDNGKGVAGTGFYCRFMPVKTGNAEVLYMGYEGIQYAATHKAKAVVCSWGGDIEEQYLGILSDLIQSAADLGALVVAAAGNQGADIDKSPFYPASFPLALAVGATGQDDKPAGFGTNYGKIVDVFAPGVGIITTDMPGLDSYGISNGTSFSAPYVGGLVGLMASKYPDWTPKFIARQIVETCDNVVNPANRTKYWGRVNAYRALTEPSYPGLVIKGFSIDGVEDGLLDYINKQYTLDVRFKNVVSPGIVTVTLLDKEKYIPIQTSSLLGQIETGQEKTGTFVFTRDPNDYVEPGFAIRLVFYATDGNKYKDTLSLDVAVSDDLQWQQESVSNAQNLSQGMEIFPNPAGTGIATVRFSLTVADQAEARIIDMLGRAVASIPQTAYLAGMHEIEFDLRQIPAGIYSCVLESKQGERLVKRLVITR